MSNTKPVLDQNFLRAYAAMTHVSAPSTTHEAIVNRVEMVKLSLPANSTCLKAAYDPVSNEQNWKTRQLNQTVRRGYTPATSSTK